MISRLKEIPFGSGIEIVILDSIVPTFFLGRLRTFFGRGNKRLIRIPRERSRDRKPANIAAMENAKRFLLDNLQDGVISRAIENALRGHLCRLILSYNSFTLSVIAFKRSSISVVLLRSFSIKPAMLS